MDDLETIDFMNVYDVEDTAAGLKRNIIENIEKEKQESGRINKTEDEFDVESLKKNAPIYYLTRRQLVELCVEIFDRLGLIEYLKIEKENVRQFFIHIAKRYKTVSYTHLTLPTICSV